MLLRIVAWSTGAKVPYAKFGINGPSGLYFQTAVNMNGTTNLYGITKFAPDPSGASGALINGYVATGWIKMVGENDAWAKTESMDKLTGSTFKVDLNGTLAIKGTVGVKVSVEEENGDYTQLTNKPYISATGLSLSGASIRGTLLKMQSKQVVMTP